MDIYIARALEACIQSYSSIEQIDGNGLLRQLAEIFAGDAAYLDKVSLMDQAFDDQPRFEELREIAFDLLLLNFFAADVEKLEGDYLESEEWESIENQTIDRGTELLNVLLYLRECADEQLEPQLDDYLKEFLLVDEDEFQDEHRIYEPVIAHQILTDSSYGEIAKIAQKISADQELAELFYPIMGFFYEQRPTAEELKTYLRHSANPGFEGAVYQLLVAYNH
ncbi:hypothetical protein [Parapedobacter indicus]|uniref:Uncharacterized protein n=1 Tax=Parapedobacter indicus TaxID=1477437 RepID=A0A1I3R194_9SPHI|nr:hypothetical protein [Parapedobacter indicus]PPL00324.1 hypothetical protein CLV26_109202 [Parapedobacter indicus]SFJ40098.1 hypothetical protein SAMN05444682_109202 [Parapedobacter indicus]